MDSSARIIQPTRFTLDSSPQDIKQHFEQHGFVLVSSAGDLSFLDSICKSIQYLIHKKGQELNLKCRADVQESFSQDIMEIFQKRRDFISHIYDATCTLPDLQALACSSFVVDCLKILGRTPFNYMDVVRVRMDFPEEDFLNTVEHQECFYHDTPASSVSVWIPFTDITAEMGPLNFRPGTHHLGRLEVVKTEERPYFKIKPGQWQKDHPKVAAPCQLGDIIFFQNALVHSSGKNRGTRPRLSAQIHLNWLDDPQYAKAGWPRTYRIKERYEKEVTYTFMPEVPVKD